MDLQSSERDPSDRTDRPGHVPERAQAALVAGLFERLPVALGLNLAVALGTVLVFLGQKPPLVLALWLGLLVATLGLRLLTWRAHRRVRPEVADRTWARRF
ncbi:MAG: hypothetical protein ACREH6_06485, partial [Geminicoccaceae bacterium]